MDAQMQHKVDLIALSNTLHTRTAIRQAVWARESEMGSEVWAPFKPPAPSLLCPSTSKPSPPLVRHVRAPFAFLCLCMASATRPPPIRLVRIFKKLPTNLPGLKVFTFCTPREFCHICNLWCEKEPQWHWGKKSSHPTRSTLGLSYCIVTERFVTTHCVVTS